MSPGRQVRARSQTHQRVCRRHLLGTKKVWCCNKDSCEPIELRPPAPSTSALVAVLSAQGLVDPSVGLDNLTRHGFHVGVNGQMLAPAGHRPLRVGAGDLRADRFGGACAASTWALPASPLPARRACSGRRPVPAATRRRRATVGGACQASLAASSSLFAQQYLACMGAGRSRSATWACAAHAMLACALARPLGALGLQRAMSMPPARHRPWMRSGRQHSAAAWQVANVDLGGLDAPVAVHEAFARPWSRGHSRPCKAPPTKRNAMAAGTSHFFNVAFMVSFLRISGAAKGSESVREPPPHAGAAAQSARHARSVPPTAACGRAGRARRPAPRSSAPRRPQ